MKNVSFIDIKDGVTIHLVIRAPKSDGTSAATSATPSETPAEVKIEMGLMNFDWRILASKCQSNE